MLTERDNRVHAVDLGTGTSDRSTDEHATAVAAEVDGRVDRPVLVAHSGAGLLLPALAGALDAARLVWLAALVPDILGGRSFADQIRDEAADIFDAEWRGLTEPPTADPVVAGYFLFHDCPLAVLRWALGTVRLFYPATGYAEPATPGPDLPSRYLLPLGDRALRSDWMRRTARERLGGPVIDLDAGHSPLRRRRRRADLMGRT